jgi:hypothetical protein
LRWEEWFFPLVRTKAHGKIGFLPSAEKTHDIISHCRVPGPRHAPKSYFALHFPCVSVVAGDKIVFFCVPGRKPTAKSRAHCKLAIGSSVSKLKKIYNKWCMLRNQ